MIFNTLTGVYPQIQANRVRAIAVASAERSPQLPNVPTVAQTLPGYEVTSSADIAAARGTPLPVIARLNREVRAVLALPDIHQRFVELGGSAPAVFICGLNIFSWNLNDEWEQQVTKGSDDENTVLR